MSPALTIGLLWVAAIGGHLALSSDFVRPRLLEAVGRLPFQGIFSVVSLAAFVPLFVVALEHVGTGNELWNLGMAGRVVASIITTVAFLILGHGVVSPPPSSMLFTGSVGVSGVARITRHPVAAAFFLIGVAHIIANGMPEDLVFFAGFSVFALATTWHQDRRKRRDVEGYEAVWQSTSFLPFLAVARGQQSLGMAAREMRAIGHVAGVLLLTLVYVFHGRLFGATPHGWGL